MNICQIGTIGFINKEGKREKKTIGGISGYIIELMEYLMERGNDVTFVGKIYHYGPREHLQYHEIQKHVTSTNRFLVSLFLRSFLIRLPKGTVIHAHRPDHYFAFAAFRSNPGILSIHGQQAVTINIRKGPVVRSIYAFLEKRAFARASFLLATDPITSDFYVKRYPRFKHKIHILPTGVNFDTFRPMEKQPLRKKLGLPEGHKVILYVGRIEPPKKVKELVKAFAILQKEVPDSHLMLVGDGTEFQAVKRLVEELSLTGRVYMPGAVMRNELPEVINCADLSVLYSGNEGSPLSVKESLACGVPVIGNPVGDIAGIIQDGVNGYLFRGDTAEELAGLMKKALEGPALAAQQCRDSIQEYATDKIYDRVLEIYRNALEKR